MPITFKLTILMSVCRETQKKRTYTSHGLINGGVGGGGLTRKSGRLISGIISSLANGWAYIRGC